MNKQRLLDAADWAYENIPPESFDMSYYRLGQMKEPKCDSIGCLVGYLTEIDYDNVIKNYLFSKIGISFRKWSGDYFDLNEIQWKYVFSSMWAFFDNSLDGAIERMRRLANGMTDDEIDLEIKKITK